MTKYMYDLLVIGGGSGGVRASRWAATQASKPKVGLIEMPYTAVEGGLGGTCVLRGCVPKKLMWYGGHYGHDFHDARAYGWKVAAEGHDWGVFMEKKRSELVRLNNVYSGILSRAGVEVIEGYGKVKGPHEVEVGGTTYTAETILIAVGATPNVPEIPGVEHAITSDHLLDLETRPERVVVVGGGYIAVEMGCILRGYGTEVDVVYRADLPLRGFDEDLRHFTAAQLETHGLRLRSHSNPARIEKQANGKLAFTLTKDGTESTIADVDQILLATGRKPNVANLGLESAGVKLAANGTVIVDDYSKTNVDSIYAVGDVTSRMQLTPVALYEGMCFANTLYGGKKEAPTHELIASAVFTTPPLGTCGITEEQAVKKYPNLDVYKSEFRPMIHTLSGSKERAIMKLLVDVDSDRVVGMHIGGKDSAEIIQGFAAAMKCGMTKAQLDSTIGIHPTSAEELCTMRTPTRQYRGGSLQQMSNL